LPANIAIGSFHVRTASALSVAERTRESAALSVGLLVRASATRRLMKWVVITTELVASIGCASSAADAFNRPMLTSKNVPRIFMFKSELSNGKWAQCAHGIYGRAHFEWERRKLR
jgi:hypothetical protein